MTTDQAKKLQPGQRVDYLGIVATVSYVRANGVTVSYWGRGLKEGQIVVHRVSASVLELPQ